MTVPSSVVELVERFRRDITAYKSATYNETQTRQEFIDPLFEALGWDIGNRQGAAAAFREVVLEYSMKIGAATKAPDYLFQLGGIPRFFVEAKKPSVNIKDDTNPAFQLRRYAWSATLPLSVLTDFEEFVVYDCRVEPDKKDKPAVARMFYVPYTEYAEKWDTITELFSREAVLGGSLEKFAQEQKAPKGATPVDVAFLHEIEGWRELLAKNIAIWNPELTQRELNYAVQMTLDRIIFLRICEDRGIEPYGKLQRLLKGGQVYKQLVEQFRDADDRYNSGLFHFVTEKGREEPDSVTPGLYIDDEPLKKIVRGLYYPDSPYEFSVLPVEILGNVYEQFLGKVIHLTKGHDAVVEEKPEVRKAGGVYYTPSYIVDYIVKNTIGKLLEDKTPKEAAELRIVDPACGSGSFLLGAYQYLLGWYLAQYVAAGPAKYKKDLYQGPRGEWKLTSSARKRILLDNIYGVDIDAQAVEVTKLSLSLKVLEGESEQTIGTTRSMFNERALPDLSDNIKCGNSLIGPDFYDNQQAAFLDDEAQYRINVFDWKGKDGFPEIMRAGGFDAVIGNPPYGIVFDERIKAYLEQNYPAFTRNNDNFVAFTHKSLGLTRIGGLFGFIIPNTFLLGPYFDDFKAHILKNSDILEIVDFGLNQVFPKPNVFTSLLFLQRHIQSEVINKDTARFIKVSDLQSFPQSLNHQILRRNELEDHHWMPATSLSVQRNEHIVQLDTLAWVKDVGLNYWTQGRGKIRGGSIADRVLYDGDKEYSDDKPYLKGRDVTRYSLAFGNHWLRHNYQELLDPSVDTFRYSPEFLEQEKIIYRQTSDRIIAVTELSRMLIDKTLHCVVLREDWRGKLALYYLLAILNSRLLTYLYRDMAREEGRTFAQVKTFRMKKLPIRTINFAEPADNARHDQMVAFVERMLDLHKRGAAAKTSQERTVLQRQIEGTDQQIDKLVYELYGLTDDEIAIVEKATK